MRLLWLATLLLLAGCADPAMHLDPGRTMLQGDDGEVLAQDAVYAFTDAEAFERYWNANQQQDLPAVDVGREAVLVFQMAQKDHGGHTARIDGIRWIDDELHVYTTATAPDDGCATTQALAQPFHVVAVPIWPAQTEVHWHASHAVHRCT